MISFNISVVQEREETMKKKKRRKKREEGEGGHISRVHGRFCTMGQNGGKKKKRRVKEKKKGGIGSFCTQHSLLDGRRQKGESRTRSD